MIWLWLTVCILAALAALAIYAPARREPFTVVCFIAAFVAGEVPVHVAVVVAAVTVAAGVGVSGHGAAWWSTLVLGTGATAAYLGLAVVAHRSGRLVSAALDAVGGSIGPGTVDPQPAWLSWWRMVLAFPIRFRSIVRIRGIDYAGDGHYRHELDVLVRRADPPIGAPVLVYIHGGAWIIGNKREQGIPMMHELAARGWVCVAINYRLSPKATWPDHVIDCKRALAWVREHIAEYGGDPSFIAVSGGSAGGHLAALVALTPGEAEWQPGFEEADTSVDACLPFYGVHDLTGDPEASGLYGPGLVELLEDKVMKLRIDEHRDVFEQASPDRRVTSAAPPMFVFQGANDTLVPPPVARRLVTRLREESASPVAYVELPCAQHAFDLMVSVRTRHTTLGAVRFLEGVRSRVAPGDRPGSRRSLDTPPSF